MGEGSKTQGLLRTVLREPLTHFLVAGLVVFLISAWRGEPVDPASRTIIIDAEQVARLGSVWERNWRRAPTSEEIDALIRDYVKEEIYYREAQRLGLDVDDPVIRRRLRSKMEFLAGAQVESARPDDATLRAWLEKHPARFAPEASYSFDQIYVGSADGSAVLRAVTNGANWTTQGETISLPKSIENAAREDVERQFGASFSAAISVLPTGKWSGPVTSGFGAHLVRLRSIKMSAKPALADVRQAVENDWRTATYKARENRAYQVLLGGYTIRISKP